MRNRKMVSLGVASALLALVIAIFTTSARVRAQDAQTSGIVGSWIVSSPDENVNLVTVRADGTVILAAKIQPDANGNSPSGGAGCGHKQEIASLRPPSLRLSLTRSKETPAPQKSGTH